MIMPDDQVWIEANDGGVSCVSPERLIEPKVTATFSGRQAEGFRRLQEDRMFTELMASAMRQAAAQAQKQGHRSRSRMEAPMPYDGRFE